MAKNEAKIKFTAETGSFNAEIQKANSEMTELRAELKLNETQMKATGATVEGLENKHNILERQLKASHDKTEALNQKVQKAVQIFGENSTEAAKLRTQLLNAQTEEERVRQAVEQCANELDEQRNAANNAESATETLTEKISRQESELKRLKAAYVNAVSEYGETSDEARNLGNQIETLSGELSANKTAFKEASDKADEYDKSLGNVDSSSDEAESATDKLSATIKKQQSDLDRLKKKYSDLVAEQKDGTDEAQTLAREIEELSGELKQNKTALNNAADAADKLDKNLDDAGDSARDSGDGFTVAKGALADLVSEAVQFGIEKVSEFIGYLRDLPEATRELRQDFATLETSFETQNLTVEQATDTWKDLYTIFGEDDRAVEAANLIAKMSDNQKDLNDWVTITQGIWGSYQDSLPVEGLAEASMETAKTGQVTGVLADALNWSSEAASMFAKYMGEDVTTAEDAFNVALSECTTEQERQALITETLTALYGDAAKKYEEASGSQLDAKEAAAELALAEADLAEKIEPVTTAWDGLKTQLITAVTPAIEAVCGGLQDAMQWLNEHPVVLKAVAAAVAVLAVGLGGLAVAAGIYTAAQWAMNSAILANPITWIIVAIIAAIAALVAFIVVVVEYWDEIKAAAENCWNAIKQAWNTAAEWFSTNVIQPIVSFFTGLWQSLQNIWNSISTACQTAWNFICNAVQVGIQLIGSILSAAFQIITLPFRFIWENCKEYVFSAWEWIKSKVSAATSAVSSVISNVFSKVSSFFSSVWNSCKSVVSSAWSGIRNAVSTAASAVFSSVSNIWNKVKSATSSAFNACKSVASSAWNSVKSAVTNAVNSAKSKVSSVWNSLKSATSSAFNACKSVATSAWNGVKSAITTPIEAAKMKVKSVVDSIKGFFSGLKLSLPKIKLPHFKITGTLSLSPPSVPRLSIEWYKDGGIFTKPTIFNTPFGFKGVGEAGAEAVLPINKLEGYIANAIEKTQNVVNLDRVAAAIEDLANRPNIFRIGDRDIALATASANDSVNGLRTSFKSRGLALD